MNYMKAFKKRGACLSSLYFIINNKRVPFGTRDLKD